MPFTDDNRVIFKFSYGFFMKPSEVFSIPNESGYDCKNRLLNNLNSTYNIPENTIDVCVNDYDVNYSYSKQLTDDIFICLKGCQLEGEDIGIFEEVPFNVLNPPDDLKFLIHKLAEIAGNKKCGHYIFVYNN